MWLGYRFGKSHEFVEEPYFVTNNMVKFTLVCNAEPAQFTNLCEKNTSQGVQMLFGMQEMMVCTKM